MSKNHSFTTNRESAKAGLNIRMWLLMLFSAIFSTNAFSPAVSKNSVRNLPSSNTKTTALDYSTAVNTHVSASASNTAFRSKMRDILKEKPKVQKAPEFITQVTTMQDFRREVINETDRTVVVRFYAPWCRACKAVAPLFYRFAKNNRHIKFVEVPVTKDNSYLHQGLGVPSLPYGHIYHPTKGLVEELKMNKKSLKEFTAALANYDDAALKP